tara:strand:+ start:23 stop:439 length:417 start_codon:yes stop_codon:yes gene_type:complete
MFFKKKSENQKNYDLIKIAALLIHTAKIDENYSIEEETIIKQTLVKIRPDIKDIEQIIIEAKKAEEDSNQILNFTKEVKNMKHESKIEIIEALWKIIYSNKEADIYETSLMRRLAGLLYIDSKIMGDIKDKISKKNLK